MSRYIVSPLEPTDLKVSVDDIKDSISSRWPDATLQSHDESDHPMLLSWRVENDATSLYCAFHRSQQAVSMEGGSLSEYAEVAVWFRKLVPARYKLFLYEQGLNEQVEVDPGMQEKEVLQGMRAL